MLPVDDSALEDPEEVLDLDARGVKKGKVLDIRDCLGQVRNKFLTNIKNRQGWAACIKRSCPDFR